MRVKFNASVKIMRSYDYCHFEVCLGSDEADMTTFEVDEMRKEAMRLVDKAVDQYKIAKKVMQRKIDLYRDYHNHEAEARAIQENFPKSEWTAKQKAIVKAIEDHEFKQLRYDYDDDYDDTPF